MTLARAAEYADVFAHFGVAAEDRPAESCYRYNPVFRTVVAGHRAAVKKARRPIEAAHGIARWAAGLAARGVRVVTPLPAPMANPVLIDEYAWVAYPWFDGVPYTGSSAQIEAAGDLLGRTHAAPVPADGVPVLPWPDVDRAGIDQDVAGLRRVLGRHAPDLAGAAVPRLAALLEAFPTATLPAVRDGDLPRTVVSSDYKAGNLVYAPGGPVLIDPDNADHTVRLLDLALAALHFHTDQPGAPGRLFTDAEWAVFRDAYLRHVTPTDAERAAWPHALTYQLCDWGVWAVVDADDWDGDWQDPRQRAFYRDLLTTDLTRFAL
jgi:spectinomycin phosphotransferase